VGGPSHKIAFAKLPTRVAVSVQVQLTGADLMCRAMQGTAIPKADLSPDEDKRAWDLFEDLLKAYHSGEINETQVLQMLLTCTGPFGWDGLAPNLHPRMRGLTAYMYGRDFVHLNRLLDAKSFIQTAIADSRSDSLLHRLAESELRALK
jgi:hypothetical protein